MLVNFEMSLAVFIPNTPRNRVIFYTNTKSTRLKFFRVDVLFLYRTVQSFSSIQKKSSEILHFL